LEEYQLSEDLCCRYAKSCRMCPIFGWDSTTHALMASGDLSSVPHSVTCQQVAEWRRRLAKWWIRQQPLRMPQVQGRRSDCLASPPTTGRAGSTTLGPHGRCGSDAAPALPPSHQRHVGMAAWLQSGCRHCCRIQLRILTSAPFAASTRSACLDHAGPVILRDPQVGQVAARHSFTAARLAALQSATHAGGLCQNLPCQRHRLARASAPARSVPATILMLPEQHWSTQRCTPMWRRL